MRILITGGAGCLGSNLIEHLYPKGHELCAIDNYATGHRDILPELPRFRLVEGTITDKSALEQLFADFEPTHIIHSAASYKDPSDWNTDIATNVIGSSNIAAAAEKSGVKQIINLQTALCYGRPQQIPIPVTHPVAPFTSYGISKTAGEAYLMQSTVPVASLRLANICGPRLSIGPIPTFYQRLKEGKSCFCSNAVRDFLDMSDFLKLIGQLLSGSAVRGIYNISTGEGKSILDVFNLVAHYLGLKAQEIPVVPVGEDDIETVILDPSHTLAQLNWKAEVTFEQMIHKQLAWYDKHGTSSIYSHLKAPKSAG